jgi:hypothetical protein
VLAARAGEGAGVRVQAGDAGAGAGRGGGVGAVRGCSNRAPAGPADFGARIIPLAGRCCGAALRVGGIWVVISVCRGGGAVAA